MENLDSLWIIDSKGLCLIQQVFHPKKDPFDKTLFSGFITAVINFSDHVFEDTIEQITMGKLDIHNVSALTLYVVEKGIVSF